MFSYFDQRYVDLLRTMTEKEFFARYKQAFFGFLWILLNPLLQMVIIGTVFAFFVKIPNYYLFLFTGLLPWQFFSLTLTKITPCYVNERNLLQKANFPREIIPISILLANFLNLLISEALLIIAIILINHSIPPGLLLLVPALFWLFTFTLGISLLTSALNVRFRDVAFFVQTAVLLWFYATPIIYSLSLIPGHLKTLIGFNPLAAPFTIFQAALLPNQPLPNGYTILLNAAISLVICLLGYSVFMRESKYFVDWL